MSGRFKIFAASAAFLMVMSIGNANAARVKDIAFVEGVRSNQLVGFGLVVGLNGTGDKSVTFTTQSITNMLNKMGLKLDPKAVKVKNTAAVIVTADMPAFSKPGSKIDVIVSSLGDATSLQGGTLVSVPLKGPDGNVYAVSQGPIALAGFTAGNAGNTVTKNHQTVGKISNGAIVEKEIPVGVLAMDELSIVLRNPDFTTAERLSESINRFMNSPVARAADAGRVRVAVPQELKDGVVDYISKIEALDVKPDTVTKVVINERTGTVVMGENVKISTVAVSHGDLSIEIKTQYLISQPAPFSQKGDTVVQPVEKTTVNEGQARLIVMPENITLGELVRAINLIGVTPRDLIAILQSIKAAGALQAELEII